VNALPQLQLAFQRYVLQGDPNMRERVVSAERVDPDQRLRIYYDAYRLRLIEALATDYEALRAAMGADEFNTACRAYIEATPSTFRNVRWYGGGLPQFLQTTAPWSEQPILSEVALFEWTLTLAFDAPDAAAVGFDELAALPADQWPTVAFVLHPCVQMVTLCTNAPAFRKATDAEENLPEVALAEAPLAWLIWRRDFTACFRSLSEPEAWALRAVQGGANFSALCEGLCEWLEPEQAAPHAAGFLRQWVDDEVITEVVASSGET
jgi:putative DNA-binding protein